MELRSPLSLLFERPCASVQNDLAAALEDHSTIFVDSFSGIAQQSSILVQNGIGLSLEWHDEAYDFQGLTPIFCELDRRTIRSSVALGLHEHLQGGLLLPEIARGFLVLASELAKLSTARAFVCGPSRLLVDPQYFIDSVDSYVAGGGFPVLATIGLDYSNDGDQLTSVGLSLFSGQEILVDGVGLDKRELMRRALRLVHDIAVHGAISEDQVVQDIDGEGLARLIVESGGALVRCSIQSDMD